MKKYKHLIPNILTCLRIILIPFFLYFAFQENYLTCLIIFVVASLTDTFDGIIARKYEYVSDFGKIYDPLADKLLVISALFVVVYWNMLFWWIAAIIVIREIVLTIYRKYLKQKGIVLSANIYGKIKTTLQMISIIPALVYKTFFPNGIFAADIIIIVLFSISALLSWISAIIYFIQVRRKYNHET